jgi:Protein of unknown function (DUF4231)
MAKEKATIEATNEILSGEEANLAKSEALHENAKKERQFAGRYKNYQPLERVAPLMTDEAYVKERLDNQIEWYNQKSQINQRRYKKYKRLEFMIAATVPVVTTLSAMVKNEDIETSMQIGAAVGGIVLVVINKMLELEEYHRLWKEYRVTCESLQYERSLYVTRTEPYDEPDAYPMLVSKVEFILNKETQKWVYQKNPDQKKQDGGGQNG